MGTRSSGLNLDIWGQTEAVTPIEELFGLHFAFFSSVEVRSKSKNVSISNLIYISDS